MSSLKFQTFEKNFKLWSEHDLSCHATVVGVSVLCIGVTMENEGKIYVTERYYKFFFGNKYHLFIGINLDYNLLVLINIQSLFRVISWNF